MTKNPKNPLLKVLNLITVSPKSALKHPKMGSNSGKFQGFLEGNTGKNLGNIGKKNPGHIGFKMAQNLPQKLH